MRLLPYLPKFACSLGLIVLGTLSGALITSAEELVGTPVPIEAGAEILPSPHIAPIPPTPPSADAVQAMAHQVANEEEMMRNMERMFEEGMKGIHSGPGFHPGHIGQIAQDFVIPIVAMLLIFGGPILLVGFLMALNYRNKRRREANINMNIDKLLAAGRDIPVELLRGDEPRSADAEESGNLNKGIKNICVGTGLFIFLTLITGIEVGSIAFILIGLGVSRVLVWKLGQTNKPQSQPIQAQD